MKSFLLLTKGLVIISILLFFIIPTANAQSSDWPTFGLNPQHTSFNSAESTLLPPLAILWSVDINTDLSVFPGPVISNGILYIKSLSGSLYAMDASTGDIIWQQQTPQQGGIAVSNKTVFATNYTDNSTLDAFNAATGQLIWSTPNPATAISITVDGNVVTTTGNYGITAFDTISGSMLWHRTRQEIGDGTPAAPTINNNIVYTYAFGNYSNTNPIFALDKITGATLWTIPWRATTNFNSVTTTIADNTLFSLGDGLVNAIDISTNTLKWQSQFPFGQWAQVAVDDKYVYLQSSGSDSLVHALSINDGTHAWTSSNELLSSAGRQGLAVLAVANNVVYAGANSNVYALDADTGNILWQHTTGGQPGIPIIADGKLFIPSADGKIYAFTNANFSSTQISIDIKPENSKNIINTNSQGKIPVAIISTQNFSAPDFIDTATLTFGHTGDEQSLWKCNPEDVNKDNLTDLMCHFYTSQTALQPTDAQAALKAKTKTGDLLIGNDTIQTTP